MASTRIPGRLPRNTSLNASQLAECLSIKPQAISDFMRKTDAGQSMSRMDLFFANGWIVTQGRAKVFTPTGVEQFAKIHGDIMEDSSSVVITDYHSYAHEETERSTNNLNQSVYEELILSQRKQIAELTEEVNQLRDKTSEMQLLLDRPSVPQEQYDQMVGERDAALERITQMESTQQSVQQANCEAISSITKLTEHLNEAKEENASLNKQLEDKAKELTEAEYRHEAELRDSEAKHKAQLDEARKSKEAALDAANQNRLEEVKALQQKAEQDRIAAADQAAEKAKEEFRNMGFFKRLFWNG